METVILRIPAVTLLATSGKQQWQVQQSAFCRTTGMHVCMGEKVCKAEACGSTVH